MDTDRGGSNNKEPPANTQDGDGNQLGNQGVQKTSHTCVLGMDQNEVVPGHLIFGLLFQNKSHLSEVDARESAIAEASQF
jgi:hypothetical protein